MTTTTYETLTTLATAIPDAAKKANSLALLGRMQKEIHGIGDRPIRWSPDYITVVQGTTDTSRFTSKVSNGDIVWGSNVIGDKLAITPLITYKSRNLWDPDPTNSRVLCFSPDAVTGSKHGTCKTCDYSKFNETDNKTPCSLNQVFWVIKPDFSDIGQISFSRTNYSNGAAWTKNIAKARTEPYHYSYELVPSKSSEHKNVFLLTAKPMAGGMIAYSVEELAFMEALFNFVRMGREEMLVAFKERAEAAPPALDGTKEATPLLASQVLDMGAATSAAPEAAKYEM